MTGARDWSGAVGDVWAAEWQRTDRGFAAMTSHLDAAILAVAPERGNAIDVGCGAGGTSIALAKARPDLIVTGVDLSPSLIDIARSRGAIHPNLSFRVADIGVGSDFDGSADLLVSRHGVMFFDDPVAGLSALRRAAGPGAALVFSCFDSVTRNRFAADPLVAVTGREPAPAASYAPGPFGFADPDFVAATLGAAGWAELRHEAVAFAYRVGGGADPVGDAVNFFTRIGPSAPLLRAAAPEARTAMIGRLTDLVVRHLHDGVVDFPAAAWLWSARAA
ncbi:MAG: class I SAM-dependent methyltransferase [Sphingomonas sp.]|jgi:SAM-dependent methyltransferase|uniref:class I SAM-dependent methyltransferase n=1 Tax=Sphingomonas sp. TaxID=28214 RepID=UPI00356565D3